MEEKTILDRVKEILGIQDDEHDVKIQVYIDLFCNKIKSICNRIDLPKELEYMAIEFARKNYLYYKNKPEDSEVVQITSASDNGQSVAYKVVETITKSDVDINSVVSKNMDEISMYAYMRW